MSVVSKLQSVPETSRLSGIPYDTLLRLIHEEKLRAVRLPGRRSFLIDPVDLECLIEASKSGSKVGTISENPSRQVAENRAPENRRRGGRRKSGKVLPFEWMEEFGVPRAR